MSPRTENRFIVGILVVSIVSILALLGLIYLADGFLAPYFGGWTKHLPFLNAGLNSISTFFLVLGLFFVLRKQITWHKLSMTSAFIFSTLFLVSYVIYHSTVGHVVFTQTGLIRFVYFFILISHVLLTIFALPGILYTFYFALRNQIDTHKKVARWTYPIWLYVSITGVLLYFIAH